jgi:site-specific recombinase XerD
MTSLIPTSPAPLAPPGAADSDAALIATWVRSKRRSAHTRAAYQRDAARFVAFLGGTPLQAVTFPQLLDFADSLDSYAPQSRKRILSAIKSLLSFGQKSGYLQFNVGAALEIAPAKNTLAERILSEEQVQRMLAMESDPVKALLLRVLYASGGRVSEVVSLRWRDAVASGDAGQLTLLGKGGETRAVLLSPATWQLLTAHRPRAVSPDAPIFATKKGRPLAVSWVGRIVKEAAIRAGLPRGVSPHWLRHAHASHALDRGATVKLVADTLGHKNIQTTMGYLHARPEESSARYLPI